MFFKNDSKLILQHNGNTMVSKECCKNIEILFSKNVLYITQIQHLENVFICYENVMCYLGIT